MLLLIRCSSFMDRKIARCRNFYIKAPWIWHINRVMSSHKLLYAWKQNSGLAKIAPLFNSWWQHAGSIFMVIFSKIQKIEPFHIVFKKILVSCCPWDVQPFFNPPSAFNSVSDAIWDGVGALENDLGEEVRGYERNHTKKGATSQRGGSSHRWILYQVVRIQHKGACGLPRHI
jgi:hypothetical protein